MRILIAEDDPVSALLLEKTLEKLGHEATVAADGEAAWQAFQAAEFPLVISDWMMPKLDGLGLCEKIRGAPTDSYPYFLMLTARSQRDDRLSALGAGVDDFLAKPLDKSDLQARLRTVERILGWQDQLQEVNNYLLASSREIVEKAAEIKRMRDEADYMANHDSLSGLLNRGAWMASADGQSPSALAIYDIDFFKRVNDQFGHPGGDQVLRAVAQRIAEAAGDAARVGRIGGEEFGVIWFEDLLSAKRAAADVISHIGATPIALVDGAEVVVSISGGFTSWIVDEGSPGSGMDRNYLAADRALYQAKEAGRRRLLFHEAA